MYCLNFGCGSIQPVGWINLDADPEFAASYQSTKQLGDDSFDVVVAHCSLQANTHQELPAVLADIRRVMKPGGVLRVSLPDIGAGCHAWRTGAIEWFPNGEDDIDDRFCNWLTWYSTARVVLTERAVINLLESAGFTDARHADPGEGVGSELDTRLDECFFIEAVA